jgi:integrase
MIYLHLDRIYILWSNSTIYTIYGIFKRKVIILKSRARMCTPKRNVPDLFLTLARTGMRVGEALALRWDDINIEERYIHIQRGFVRSANSEQIH